MAGRIKRRGLSRPKRQYIKNIFLATEGRLTEVQYFKMLNQMQSNARFRFVEGCCSQGKDPDPASILASMQAHVDSHPLKRDDRAFLIIDKDSWNTTDINAAIAWGNSEPKYGAALTNPCFEYWLLLHFHSGRKITTKREVKNQLKRYVPNYDKQIRSSDFKEANIKQAIENANADTANTSNNRVKRSTGTTVQLLVSTVW